MFHVIFFVCWRGLSNSSTICVVYCRHKNKSFSFSNVIFAYTYISPRSLGKIIFFSSFFLPFLLFLSNCCNISFLWENRPSWLLFLGWQKVDEYLLSNVFLGEAFCNFYAKRREREDEREDAYALETYKYSRMRNYFLENKKKKESATAISSCIVVIVVVVVVIFNFSILFLAYTHCRMRNRKKKVYTHLRRQKRREFYART